MTEAPSTHPTAEDELEEIEATRERLDEEEDRLRRGKVELPWPQSSKGVLFVGALSLVGGGAVLGAGMIVDQSIGIDLAALILLVAGVVLINFSRWLHEHFETGSQPRYVDPVAADGGED